MLVVDDHMVFLRKIERNIRGVKKIVCEPLLNHVLFVSGTDDEVIETKVTVSLHDMPENRHSADLYHRFRSPFRLLCDSCAKPAGQKYRLHRNLSLTCGHSPKQAVYTYSAPTLRATKRAPYPPMVEKTAARSPAAWSQISVQKSDRLTQTPRTE